MTVRGYQMEPADARASAQQQTAAEPLLPIDGTDRD